MDIDIQDAENSCALNQIREVIFSNSGKLPCLPLKEDTRGFLHAWGCLTPRYRSLGPSQVTAWFRSLFNVDSSTGQFIILSDQLIYFMSSPIHLNIVLPTNTIEYNSIVLSRT